MSDHFTIRFLKSVTPQPGDPTFSILKTHLLVEDLLRTFLEQRAANPAAMKKAKLTFAQALQVTRAFCTDVDQDHWIWKAMGNLNKLRNDLAHKLEPEELHSTAETYASNILTSIGIPLPKPLTDAQRAEMVEAIGTAVYAEAVESFASASYSRVDIANSGLYGAVLAALGFDERGGIRTI
ncbi:hypothetical protein LK542_17645 [Massilia sp. IC2-477]|uniref:hypothetical protein n=1 Tax=Massilia sp. IC2-477 TaxID=2887198 RepID=UPI001D0FF721|nr:hypothetical protein [Massilia sp. IC2-477]MCC2957444.1 hypothetical protein [Massilia sp. IC2-477]